MKRGEITYRLQIDGTPILIFSDLADVKRKALEVLANAGGKVEILVDYAGLARNEILRWDPSSSEWMRTDAILSAPPSAT